MIWICAELIHFFSVNFTLRPGMMIITGTPAGTAWSVDQELGGRWQPKQGVVAATRYCLPGDRDTRIGKQFACDAQRRCYGRRGNGLGLRSGPQ